MNIQKHTPAAALELLFPACLATLSELNQDTMTRAIRNSTNVWIGDVNGEIFGFWGLIPPTLFSDKAYLWFYSTAALQKYIFRFIRHSRKVTAELLEQRAILVGHGMAGDAQSLRWLKWCGAEFSEPVANGQVVPFEIRRK
jgi:hypothetical protein